jgi:predicted DNA-binding transcriptional regulator AlpA
MLAQSNNTGSATTKAAAVITRFLTPSEVASLYQVSLSWLAKRRMTGDGPPFVKIGRSVRYPEAGLVQWAKSRQRLSTSEH